jgi:transcription elongation factor Elf1
MKLLWVEFKDYELRCTKCGEKESLYVSPKLSEGLKTYGQFWKFVFKHRKCFDFGMSDKNETRRLE